MQDYIKRYFWLVGVITIVVCAVFAARIVGNVVEAKYLTDEAKGPKLPKVKVAASAPVVASRSKDGSDFAKRNMFCADCVPEVIEPDSGTTDTASDPSNVPMTALSLQLVATTVGGKPEYSFASIVNTTNQAQGGFFVGDKLPGAGPVRTISYKYVDFENPQAGNRLERVMLLGEPPPAKTKTPTVTAAAPVDDGAPKDAMEAAIDAGVKKIDDTHYEIDRKLVDQVLANPMAVSKGARVVAAVKNGNPDGFKMYAIKPSSAYAKLGFSNGDTLHEINGFQLTSMDKALEMYTKLKEANSLQVQVTRRGKPVTLNYTIR